MNRKERYKDLSKWRKTCNSQRKKYYRKTAGAPNSGTTWTQKEMDMVLAQDISDMKLSKKIGRSVGSIQVVRSRLKSKMAKQKAN